MNRSIINRESNPLSLRENKGSNRKVKRRFFPRVPLRQRRDKTFTGESNVQEGKNETRGSFYSRELLDRALNNSTGL